MGTLHGWIKATQNCELDMGIGKQNPETGMTLVEDMKKLKEENKAYQKTITQLRKENAFLEEKVSSDIDNIIEFSYCLSFEIAIPFIACKFESYLSEAFAGINQRKKDFHFSQ